jgi:hypothetical protein
MVTSLFPYQGSMSAPLSPLESTKSTAIFQRKIYPVPIVDTTFCRKSLTATSPLAQRQLRLNGKLGSFNGLQLGYLLPPLILVNTFSSLTQESPWTRIRRIKSLAPSIHPAYH